MSYIVFFLRNNNRIQLTDIVEFNSKTLLVTNTEILYFKIINIPFELSKVCSIPYVDCLMSVGLDPHLYAHNWALNTFKVGNI